MAHLRLPPSPSVMLWWINIDINQLCPNISTLLTFNSRYDSIVLHSLSLYFLRVLQVEFKEHIFLNSPFLNCVCDSPPLFSIVCDAVMFCLTPPPPLVTLCDALAYSPPPPR